MNCIFKQVRLVSGLKHVSKTLTAQLHVTRRVGFLTRYMDSCVNTFDEERFVVVGHERLCAEWVLKCGGRLRWVGSEEWLYDYNSLPGEETTKHLKIQDIDLSESVAMATGVRHMWPLSDLNSLKLDSCKYVNDKALEQLTHIESQLKLLQISNNKLITDNGLLSLAKLSFLQELHLKNLKKVGNKDAVYNKLQTALPDCEILYADLET